jgi:hypothetical protein
VKKTIGENPNKKDLIIKIKQAKTPENGVNPL